MSHDRKSRLSRGQKTVREEPIGKESSLLPLPDITQNQLPSRNEDFVEKVF